MDRLPGLQSPCQKETHIRSWIDCRDCSHPVRKKHTSDHGETAGTAVTLSERNTHQIMDRLPGLQSPCQKETHIRSWIDCRDCSHPVRKKHTSDHGQTAGTAVTLSERNTHQIMERLPGLQSPCQKETHIRSWRDCRDCSHPVRKKHTSDHGQTAGTAVALSERYALYQKKKNVLYLTRKQPRSISTINKITRGGADPGYL